LAALLPHRGTAIDADEIRNGAEGLLRAGKKETAMTVMKEFMESASRETGDTNVVTLLTTAVIAMAAVVMATASFAIV
jgi:ribosomal protein S7